MQKAAEDAEKLCGVEKVSQFGPFVFDNLVDAVADRRYLIQAILNYAALYEIPVESVDPQKILKSSAGVRVWAEAKISRAEDAAATVPSDLATARSGMELSDMGRRTRRRYPRIPQRRNLRLRPKRPSLDLGLKWSRHVRVRLPRGGFS